jgi:hypothetical protein
MVQIDIPLAFLFIEAEPKAGDRITGGGDIANVGCKVLLEATKTNASGGSKRLCGVVFGGAHALIC